jgi:MFS family permease
MLAFLAENRRWLGAGFLLTFASSFGQTFFISLFAGEIKAAYGLSDGGWGGIYTAATLGAAGLLFLRGALADTMPLGRLAPLVMLVFSAACLAMALGKAIPVLLVAVLLLRFAGQGMCGHIAMTATGRWFQAHRGRAVAIAGLGFSVGEAVLPLVAVALIGLVGWRETWGIVAAVLALVAAPAFAVLLARGRQPKSAATGEEIPGLRARHWTRREALHHWLFPALLPIMLTPGFIGTVVFFHQVHTSQVKGWSLAAMAPGYSVYAALTVAAALAAGWAADRLGSDRLLPVLLLPMAAGMAVLGPAATVGGWFLTLGFLGLTQGMASALWGAFLPSVYGTRHLGAVRSLATSLMVVSTAAGPGITGILIDAGIDFPAQALAMALWCLAMSVLGVAIVRRLGRESAATA